MSINPVLTQDIHTRQLIPHCTNGEYLLMYVSETRITITIGNSRLKGVGDVFISTHRIIFIKKRDAQFHEQFCSISMPYTHIDDPRFRQPIFGSNYLEGVIHPVTTDAAPLSADGKFCLYIDSKCSFLLKEFFTYYARVRNNPGYTVNSHPFAASHEARSAFVDPNEPSYVYLAQPETENPSGEPNAAEEGTDESNGDQRKQKELVNVAGTGQGTATAAAAIPFLF